MSLPSMNILYLTVSEIYPRQNIKGQSHCSKAKVKSGLQHDVAYLHPQPMSLPSINFLCLTASEIFKTQGYYGKIKGQVVVTPRYGTPTSPNQCLCQVSISNKLRFLGYSLDKILKLKVTTARSNQG